MKVFAVVEDKLPLSWNKGDQAVLPPTEFTRSSHKAAGRVKSTFFIFLLCPRKDSSTLGFSNIFEFSSRG